ncbi:hypothetical protein DLAC_03231 [Tieghemostelium lacteum]|uniref:Uncharacterized protein n=1 Tax=Tieghemostelium lacteum TaxID=361077 RepID=A0A152A1W8_TIELA|nr:hypothetical protein DLAC_03231 [Tieghemostelium lacteum]|eukprot:KYR00085.1 hypothetical protein DLAC_03231 [Tieghemostelium lacteum]
MSQLITLLNNKFILGSIIGSVFGSIVLYQSYKAQKKRLTVDNCYYLQCLQNHFITTYKDAILKNQITFRIKTVILAVGREIPIEVEEQVAQYLYQNIRIQNDTLKENQEEGADSTLHIYSLPLENLENYDIYNNESRKSSVDVVITIESPQDTCNFTSLLKKFSTISILLKKSSLFLSFFNHMSYNSDTPQSWNHLSLSEIKNLYTMCGYNIVNSTQNEIELPNQGKLTFISSISPDWDVNTRDEISFETFDDITSQ